MSRFVVKFGGTSLATPQAIEVAAKIVLTYTRQEHEVAVVVSAMGDQTNQLTALIQALSYAPTPREYDVVLSTGEHISCGLMAIALNQQGLSSRSFLPWQVPMYTDGFHAHANYIKILPDKLITYMQHKGVAVFPGFQGINEKGDLTTIGRGGSDITAVALAAALKADKCFIYTDVPGVLTADPRIVPKAQPIAELPRQCLMTLATLGAHVIHPRAVALAEKNNVTLQILSTFTKTHGTLVKEGKNMEEHQIKSIAIEKDICWIRLAFAQNKTDVLPQLTKILTQNRFTFFPLVQDSTTEQIVVSFFLSMEGLQRFQSLYQRQSLLKETQLQLSQNLTKVSLVGMGLSGRHITQTATLLAQRAIHLKGLFNQENQLSVLIDNDYGELVLRLLHEHFICTQKT